MDLDFGVNGHNYGDHYEYDDNGSDHFVGSEEQDYRDRQEYIMIILSKVDEIIGRLSSTSSVVDRGAAILARSFCSSSRCLSIIASDLDWMHGNFPPLPIRYIHYSSSSRSLTTCNPPIAID